VKLTIDGRAVNGFTTIEPPSPEKLPLQLVIWRKTLPAEMAAL